MNKYTHTILTAILLAVPVHAYALTVDALDTVAGLTTEVTVSDAAPQTQVAITLTSPFGDVIPYTINTDIKGVGQTWVAGSNVEVAGEYHVQAGQASAYLQVHPDSIDIVQSFIEASVTQVSVGQQIAVTVVLVDRFGNPLPGRIVELISSRPQDRIESMTKETNTQGQQDFIIRAAQDGIFTLRAMDLISAQVLDDTLEMHAGDMAQSMGGPMQVTYNSPKQFYPDASAMGASMLGQVSNPQQQLDHFEIQIGNQGNGDLPTLRINEAEDVRVTAIDQSGNIFRGYEGTVYMATTDPNAELPKDGVIAFGFSNQGIRSFPLVLKFGTVGTHTIILTESPNSAPEDPRNALGYQEVQVVGQQIIDTQNLRVNIAEPASNALYNETEIMVTGNGPAFINLTVTGGIQDVTGESDRDGNYAIPISLDPTKEDQEIIVQDTDGRYKSAPRTFRIDVTPATIETVIFAPENPVEGTDVLLVVQTEPNTPSVTAEVDGEIYTLTSTDPKTGKYQMLLQTPEGGGEHIVTIRTTDAIGNTTETTSSLVVHFRGLPQVQNVVAEAHINEVALRWDPIEDTAEAYRIYVGTEPDNFLYTLDTDRPTAAATVAGLQPGSVYYFSVTALQEGRESKEKSTVINATVLGLTLDITPNDGALFMEWNTLSPGAPLSTFLLEYGVEPDTFTEKRTLNGDLRAYTLRDLINGVSYYMKLTPIATTGEIIEDLAAKGQGTPTGNGFTAAPGDPIPSGLHAGASTSPPTPNPSNLNETGIPAWMLWTVFAVSVVLFQLHLRHKKVMNRNAAFMQHMQSRYNQ